VPALRALINSAYQILGDMGLNFTGVDQDDEITRRRMRGREVYVIERDGELIGTVTVAVKESEGTRYGYINVLAVAPNHQRRGIGSELMAIAERRAREIGLDRVRLDTAIPVRWDGKSYRSAIMEKLL